MPEITLHHLNNSRSQRVLWLLEELGVEYEVKRYERNAKTMLAPPELRELHPLGKSPMITVGDKVIAETGLIIEYLIEQYGDGRFQPSKDNSAHMRNRYWMHALEGSVMPYFVMALVFTALSGPKVPFIIRPISKGIAGKVMKEFVGPNIERSLAYMNEELSKHEWLAGDELSGCDFLAIFVAEAANARVGVDEYPHIKRYLQQIQALPTYQKALEVGGPYEIGAA